jgi:hypothetical protein
MFSMDATTAARASATCCCWSGEGSVCWSGAEVGGGVEAWVDGWAREEDDGAGCCVAVVEDAVDILRRKFIRAVVIVKFVLCMRFNDLKC